MPNRTTAAGTFVARHAETPVRTALTDTRIVAVVGPRQAGKTTAIGHYRDKDGVEVDLVLERPPGAVVGIEVKAGATARPRDFRGLARLEEAAGDGFACGIVLHDGERVQQAGPRLFAMPVKMLWEA